MLARLEPDAVRRAGARAAAARCRGLLAPDEDVPRRVRRRARAPRRAADAVRAGAHAARARRAAAARQAARRGARAADRGARRVRAARRAAVGRARAHRAARHRRPGRRAPPRRPRPSSSRRTSCRSPCSSPGHDQPRGGGRALPLTEDDRVPPRPDLPQARRPRPRAARAADGDGAARGRARPRRARRRARARPSKRRSVLRRRRSLEQQRRGPRCPSSGASSACSSSVAWVVDRRASQPWARAMRRCRSRRAPATGRRRRCARRAGS